eukprot:scaffold85617_cov39-Phaeocystis_antarctica.AAC.3
MPSEAGGAAPSGRLNGPGLRSRVWRRALSHQKKPHKSALDRALSQSSEGATWRQLPCAARCALAASAWRRSSRAA